MRVLVRTRTLVIAAASLSLLAVPLAMPASAAAAPPGACKKLATKTAAAGKLTATLSQCTPAAATGGTGGGTFSSSGATSGTLNITIKWAGTHGTTKGNVKFGPAKGLGKCPKGTTTRVALTGKVTGGTGTAFKTIKTGQAISGSVCVGAKTDTLEPGTVLKF